jgi:hypothetical protein
MYPGNDMARVKIVETLTIKRLIRRFSALLISTVLLLIFQNSYSSQPVTAQAQAASAGSPPIAALISVSPPDANGNVTISGAAGAVPSSFQVAVRNLYTDQTVYTNAGGSGSFSVTLFANGSTPFWISAARDIPAVLRDIPGWMPGGPGTIVYSSVAPDTETRITQLIMDGSLGEWASYPEVELEDDAILALRNQNSLYLALQNNAFAPDVTEIALTLGFDDNSSFEVTLNPTVRRSISVRQLRQINLDRGVFRANLAVLDGIVEVRLPLDIAVGVTTENTRLLGIAVTNAEGTVTLNQAYDLAVPAVEEVDGAASAFEPLQTTVEPFYIAGAVAQGAGYWYATGLVNTLEIEPGSTLSVEMDVTLVAPNLPADAADLTMIGDLRLQPVTVSSRQSNNGWSSLQTPSGLAIDNLVGDISLGQTTTEWVSVTRLTDRLAFTLRFDLPIPENLPAGSYVPNFRGGVIEASGRRSGWWQNGVFGNGDGISEQPFTRLPLVLSSQPDEVEQRLPFALFYDHTSEGSRGILPQEDTDRFALSNRVKFNAPTYILPPGTYPVEPYLLNQLPNAYQSSAAPLLPLNLDESEMSISVARPNDTENGFGTVTIVQPHVASPTVDPRDSFGSQSPVNIYRLTTLDPEITAYNFDLYGEYEIQLTGTLEDTFGHRYTGGGTYRVLIADLLDLLPGVLPGTPFETTDRFYPGFRVIPGVPADVTVELRIYPLDGSETVVQRVEGQANPYGIFIPSPVQAFDLNTPGEYVVDYEARYETAEGRLWAASLRAAGVIASPEPSLVLHGRRGLDGYEPMLENLPAWFNTQRYPQQALSPVEPRFYYPYFAGDIAVIAPNQSSGIDPRLQLQDVRGVFETWLSERLSLQDAFRRDALPLLTISDDTAINPVLDPEAVVQQAYGYISAVRPNASVRQFVYSGEDTPLALNWDADDPLNQQYGAGVDGLETGDIVYLFGGAIVRNEALDFQEAVIYGATSEVGFVNGDPLGARVYPPYRHSEWLPISEENAMPNAVNGTFFHLTSAHPGQVFERGSILSIAGQAAPALQSRVSVTLTSPNGDVEQFDGLSNRIGYFYDPEGTMTLDEIGMWTVEITVSPVALTSEGSIENPPVGGILGAVENRFPLYVTASDTPPLEWNRSGDIEADTPAGAFFNFTLNIPAGLTEVQAYRTVTTPGYVLDDGQLQTAAASFPYQYSPPRIADSFPILETQGGITGPAGSDIVTVTFAVSGVDENGQRQLYTRTFEFLTNRILSFEGES